eukprot:scaffold529667_cov153-Attheya_sp.AAC.1
MASFVVLSLAAAKRPRWMSSPPYMVIVRTSARPAGSWASAGGATSVRVFVFTPSDAYMVAKFVGCGGAGGGGEEGLDLLPDLGYEEALVDRVTFDKGGWDAVDWPLMECSGRIEVGEGEANVWAEWVVE